MSEAAVAEAEVVAAAADASLDADATNDEATTDDTPESEEDTSEADAESARLAAEARQADIEAAVAERLDTELAKVNQTRAAESRQRDIDAAKVAYAEEPDPAKFLTAVDKGVRALYAEELLAGLPKDKRPAFEAFIDGKEFSKDWAVEWAELHALDTKAVKGLSLDEFLALSPKAKAAHARLLSAKFDEGRRKPLPKGEPSSNGGRATSAGDPRDRAEAEAMHAGRHPSGKTLSNTEFRAVMQRLGA